MGRKTKKQMARKSVPKEQEVQRGPVHGQVTFDEAHRVRTPNHPSRNRSQMPSTAKTGVRRDPKIEDAGQQFINGLKDIAQRAAAGRKSGKPAPSPEELNAAGMRMKALGEFLNKPPVPIIEQLEGLGITVQRMRNVPGDRRYDTIVIKVTEIEAADRKIKAEGTLYEQLYRGQVP